MARLPMETGKWSTASVRIVSEVLGVEDISTALNIVPDRAFAKGDLASPQNPRSQRLAASVWLLDSVLGNDRWPDEHIAMLLSRIADSQSAVRDLAASGQAELMLGYGSESGQGGCVLSAEILKELADFGLDLVLDLYPPEASESTGDLVS
jgi:hypothetical protein